MLSHKQSQKLKTLRHIIMKIKIGVLTKLIQLSVVYQLALKTDHSDFCIILHFKYHTSTKILNS